jgi:hypothetical protein
MKITQKLITYTSFLVSTYGKKSMRNMALSSNTTDKVVKNSMPPSDENIAALERIAIEQFKESKRLTLVIDSTSVAKKDSRCIENASHYYNTKTGRMEMCIKTLVGAITDGKYTFPISVMFPRNSNFYDDAIEHNRQLFFLIIQKTRELFPKTLLTVVADGEFSNDAILKYLSIHNIHFDMRIASNRIISFAGKEQQIKKFKHLKVSNRRSRRTIRAQRNGLWVYITAILRVNKRGNKSIIYIVSTYKAEPRVHTNEYKKRWTIETIFRTVKQSLGIKDCFSTKGIAQVNHITATFVAYALMQLERKRMRLSCPEEAISLHRERSIKNRKIWEPSFARNFQQLFEAYT